MRVIDDKYSTLCSQSSQPQGKVAEATRHPIVLFIEDGMCTRNKHTCLSSNDTKDSLTLFLAQQLINQSNYENLLTVTHINVIAYSGRHVVLV